ncbi:hypothetical protein CF319_g6181 [Tilletia indica]|nr:hypothetical protein CF319_g6181 [Tilletia indica]
MNTADAGTDLEMDDAHIHPDGTDTEDLSDWTAETTLTTMPMRRTQITDVSDSDSEHGDSTTVSRAKLQAAAAHYQALTAKVPKVSKHVPLASRRNRKQDQPWKQKAVVPTRLLYQWFESTRLLYRWFESQQNDYSSHNFKRCDFIDMIWTGHGGDSPRDVSARSFYVEFAPTVSKNDKAILVEEGGAVYRHYFECQGICSSAADIAEGTDDDDYENLDEPSRPGTDKKLNVKRPKRKEPVMCRTSLKLLIEIDAKDLSKCTIIQKGVHSKAASTAGLQYSRRLRLHMIEQGSQVGVTAAQLKNDHHGGFPSLSRLNGLSLGYDPFIAVDCFVGQNSDNIFAYQPLKVTKTFKRFSVGLKSSLSIRNLIRWHGRPMFMDSSWKNKNENRAPLTFVTTTNAAGHMVPCAAYLSADSTARSFAHLLKALEDQVVEEAASRRHAEIDRLVHILVCDWLVYYEKYSNEEPRLSPTDRDIMLDAHRLWETDVVTPSGTASYRVLGLRPSGDEPRAYVVNLRAAKLSCTCNRWRQSGKFCAHMHAARIFRAMGSVGFYQAAEEEGLPILREANADLRLSTLSDATVNEDLHNVWEALVPNNTDTQAGRQEQGPPRGQTDQEEPQQTNSDAEQEESTLEVNPPSSRRPRKTRPLHRRQKALKTKSTTAVRFSAKPDRKKDTPWSTSSKNNIRQYSPPPDQPASELHVGFSGAPVVVPLRSRGAPVPNALERQIGQMESGHALPVRVAGFPGTHLLEIDFTCLRPGQWLTGTVVHLFVQHTLHTFQSPARTTTALGSRRIFVMGPSLYQDNCDERNMRIRVEKWYEDRVSNMNDLHLQRATSPI